MRYWLCKSEPDCYSIDNLKRDRKTLWDSVRNYQARNYLKEMAPGDVVLYYHSNGDPAGVAGIAEISKTAVPDPTQFDKQSEFYDEKATKDAPRWFSPELKFSSKFKNFVPLEELRQESALKDMVLLQRGSRLSVQPVTKKEFEIIAKLGGESA